MRKIAALISGSLLCCGAMVAPVFASTETNVGTYTQHQADCLVLLFTDPKAHEEQCGGPFAVTPPPSSSTGYRLACGHYSEIAPYDIYGRQELTSQQYLVAGDPCCAEWISPNSFEKAWPSDNGFEAVPATRFLVAC